MSIHKKKRPLKFSELNPKQQKQVEDSGRMAPDRIYMLDEKGHVGAFCEVLMESDGEPLKWDAAQDMETGAEIPVEKKGSALALAREPEATIQAIEAQSAAETWAAPEEIIFSVTNEGREECDDLVAIFQEEGFRPEISRLLVRANPDEASPVPWELVCGERRLRAALKAGLKAVPIVVRALTDVQALEMQMLENLHRKDLTPFQEADNFARLLALHDAAGRLLHSVETLARKIGKPTTYVSERRGLARIGRDEAARKSTVAGMLGIGHLALISRLPTVELRDEVTSLIVMPDHCPAPLPVRDARALVRDRFVRELKGSKFDPSDAGLVPVSLEDGQRVAGGACVDCPHNTKNIADDDFATGKKSMCLNPCCYAEKEAAEYERWCAAEKARRGAVVTLPAAENKALWDFTGKKLAPSVKMVELNSVPAEYELKKDVPAQKWSALVAGREVPVIVVRDEAGKVHELVDRTLAVAAAEQNEHKIFRPSAAKTAPAVQEKKKRVNDAEAAEIAQRVADEREEKELHGQGQVMALLAKCGGLKRLESEHWHLLGERLILLSGCGATAIGKAFGWQAITGEDSLVKHLKSLAHEALPGTVLALSFFCDLDFLERGEGGVEARKTFAKTLGVDLKAVAKVVTAEVAALRVARAEAKEIAEGLAWDGKREQAEEFKWDENGSCVEPLGCFVKVPTGYLCEAYAARSEKGWHAGWGCSAAKQKLKAGEKGTWARSPLTQPLASYSTRELALRAALLGMRDEIADEAAPAQLGAVRIAVIERLNLYIARIAEPTAVKKKKGGQ